MKPEKKPSVLLINPYIHDFKLYDEWMKPLGLYYIADYLIKNGFDIHYITTISREHPELSHLKDQKDKAYHTGSFHAEVISKPKLFGDFPRKYKRYGIPLWLFQKELKSIPHVDLILITSYMTYWYPGVIETVRIVKQHFPYTPVILGGLYTTLCYEHAKKHSGANHVLKGHFNNKSVDKLFRIIDIPQKAVPMNDPYPRYNIEDHPGFLPLLTEFGCPYNCTYCANKFINPSFKLNEPVKITTTIDHYYYYKTVRDFAFYDDALLYRFDENLGRILTHVKVRKLDCRFHTPNAVHARFINQRVADMLYQSGFTTIRLGFESSDLAIQKQTGNKASIDEIRESIAKLKSAGFKKYQIGVYIMMGLKGQTIKEIMDSIDFISSLGVLVKPVTYSPIPHTMEFNRYLSDFPEIAEEPLYQNDSFFLIHSGFMSYDELRGIKDYVRRLNSIDE